MAAKMAVTQVCFRFSFSLFKFLFFCHLCLSMEIENGESSEEGITVDPAISQSDLVSPGSTHANEMENADTNYEPGPVLITGEKADLPHENSLEISDGQTGEATDINGQESDEKNIANESNEPNGTKMEPVKAENDTIEESKGNITKETTEPLWSCEKFNLSRQSVVILDDNNSLSSWLDEINRTTSCAIVLFYAKWCYFSAMLAPAYNAAGRAFEGIPILALDVYTYNSLNTRYGIVGVPTIILFHQSKPVARFNRTRTFKDLVEFIHQSTGMEYNTSVEVSSEDYLGPLPSSPSEDPNYYLLASYVFIACVALLFLWRLRYVQMLWEHVPPWSAVRRVFLPAEREKEE